MRAPLKIAFQEKVSAFRWDEPIRRHSVVIADRLDEMRGNDKEQLSFVILEGAAAEQCPEDG